MVTKIQRRRSKDPSGRGGTQQNSILEHLSPPILPDDTTTGNNNDNGGGRTTRNNGGAQRANAGGDGTGRRRRAPTPPPPNHEESTLQSHPRLSRIMEEAHYEAFVDPFRGITPFFSLCNDEEGSGVANNDTDNIDTQSPWIQCGPVLQGECTAWKFERGEDFDAKTVTNNNNKKQQKKGAKKQQQEVEIVNVDDDSVVAVQQLNFNNNNNDDDNKVRIVQCGCPTIDSWATDEWHKYQQHLSKKNKKGGKKRKRKNNSADVEEVTDLSCDDANVMTMIDDDAENNLNNSLAAMTPVLICGERKLNGDECCPCDFNPFCLASLGGILDQYRYNAAKIRYLISIGKLADLLDDDDSDDDDSVTLQTQEGTGVGRLNNGSNMSSVTGAEFAKLVRRHWSEIPSLGLEKDDSDGKKTAGQNNDIRGSILVDSDKTRTHASKFVCNGEEEVERYCQMIDSCQNELILSPSQEPVTDGKTRISMPPGLRNLGATCYLNSQLQCLAQNLGFVHGLFTWTQIGASNRMSQVLSHMQSILARMKYGPQSVICTNEFATALSLENDEMQDPNEFARLLFDRMQESFRKSSDYRLENLLPSLFRGTSAYVTKCHECNGHSERQEAFMDLSVPIVNVEAKSAGDDVDVQRCLDAYLQPELLVGDNQYYCSTCAKKADASRSLVLETIPPVLNIQLARYVFDMATFSKKKLATKVKLPRTLTVPTKQADEAGCTNTTANYILCAVQNHLGTSAHGGHYIADVLDWTTGVWYEFNDEEVSVLEEGPTSSFDPNSNNSSKKGKSAKVDGSTDAYNLFYVEQNYLSQQSNIQLKSTVDRIDNKVQVNDSGDDILTSIDVQRVERYKCEKEHQKKSDILKKRLAFRREQIMRLLCSQSNLFTDAAHSVSDKIWVDATMLRKYFSCQDGLEAIFQNTAASNDLEDCKLLCSHSTGLHPKAVRKGKLLSRELYAELNRIVLEEFTQFSSDEGSEIGSLSKMAETAFKNHAVDNNSLICKPCGIQFQSESRNKLETFQTLISIYEDLAAGQNDLDLDSDSSQSDVFVIYRPWVTALRKCVESNLTVMKGTKKSKKDVVYYGGVDDLNLEGVIAEAKNPTETNEQKKAESSDNAKLDCQVNTTITCEHGKCLAMYKRRSVRLVPPSVWSKILKVFPDAIPHEFEPKMEEALGNCATCFQEKQKEELFPVKLTEWRNQIKEPGTLRDLYTKGGNDGDACSNTPPEIEMFLEVCADSGDKTNKLTCYIVQCRDIQRWRDAYDCVVKSKKARKTNDFIKKQLNKLLFNSCSDDAEARKWNFRSLICNEHKKAVGIPSPDIDTINGDSNKLKEWLSSLSKAKFELLLEDEFRSFISSLSSLEAILHGNNSTGLDQGTPTVSISIKDGAPRVNVQPTPCSDGCVISLFGDEYLDNGIICKKEGEADTAAAKAEVVPIEEDNDGPICKIIVHQVEGGMNIDVAASSIALNASSNEDQEATNQRRGLRKRKAKGTFPVHEVEMALDGNLAHFRLLLYQVSRENVRNQRLYIMSQQLQESSVTEMAHVSDGETMQDLISKLICNSDSTSEDEHTTIHVIMSYDDSATQNKRGTGKRMSKEERDEEDAIIATLTDKACGGWKTADVVGRGKKSGKRQERGFQGTFLQSSLSQNSETEQNTPAKDSNDSMIVDVDEAKSKDDSSERQKASDVVVDEVKQDVTPSEASSEPSQDIHQTDSGEIMIIDTIKAKEESCNEVQNMVVDGINEEDSSSESEMEMRTIVQDDSKRRKCDAKCAIHESTCTIMDALDIGPGWTVHVLPRKSGTGQKVVEDKLYFSPTGEKFRSFVSVQRHLQQNASTNSPSKRKREASQAESVQSDETDSSDIEEFETVAGQMRTSKLKAMRNIIDKELGTRKDDDDQTGHKSKYFTTL